jgi:hypothetical protein
MTRRDSDPSAKESDEPIRQDGWTRSVPAVPGEQMMTHAAPRDSR